MPQYKLETQRVKLMHRLRTVGHVSLEYAVHVLGVMRLSERMREINKQFQATGEGYVKNTEKPGKRAIYRYFPNE